MPSPSYSVQHFVCTWISTLLVAATGTYAPCNDARSRPDVPVVIDAEWSVGAPSPSHDVHLDDAGLVTVSVESFDFNPRFDLLDSEGSIVVSDTDSGTHFNARAAVELEGNTTFTIRVGTQNDLRGAYRVSVVAGDVPPVTSPTLEAELFASYGDQSARLAESIPGRRSVALQWYLAAANLEFELLRDDRAKRLLRIALPLADETGDRARKALAQLLLGAVQQRAGSAREAVELLEPLLTLVADNAEMNDFVYGYLGSAYGDLGRFDDGRRLLAALLDTSTKRGNTHNVASAHRRLGLLERSAGQATHAHNHFQASLTAWREAGDLSGEAGVLLDLAAFDIARRDVARGLEACRHVITMDIADDVLVRARSLLAETLFASGRIGEAQEQYRVALDRARAAGLARSRQAIRLRLAVIATRVGDSRRALEHLDTLSNAEETSAEMHAAAQLERALLLGRDGDIDEAVEHITEAVTFFHNRGDKEHEVSALTNRSLLLLMAGDIDAARRDCSRALDLAGTDIALSAAAMTHSSFVELHAERWTLARTLAERAVALSRDASDDDLLLNALGVLADVALGTRDIVVAQGALDEANQLVDWGAGVGEATALQRRVLAWLGDTSQDITAQRVSTAIDESDRQAAVTAGFQEASRWKGRRLLEGIVQLRLGMRTRESESLRIERRDALAGRDAALHTLAQSIAHHESPQRIRSLRERVQALTKRAADLDARWLEAAPRDGDLELPRGHAPSYVAEHVLDSHDVLIEYVQGRDALYAYVVTHHDVTFLELGNRDSLNTRIDTFIEAVSDPLLAKSAGDIAQLGEPLYRALLAPALKVTERSSATRPTSGEQTSQSPLPTPRLVIIPSGRLTALPFEALVVSQSKETPETFDDLTFVLDQHEVCYAPSSTVLVELAARTEQKSRRAPLTDDGRVLLLADPEHTGFLAGAMAAPLPGTRREARAILENVAPREDWSGVTGDARELSIHHDRVELHIGREAHLGRMFGDLRGFDIIHLAAHGRVDADDVRNTALLFAADQDGNDELSVGDVLSMVLDARLTVLSACESARGTEHRGEGVQSLARAFLYAGSDAVIASLWAVDDVETARLMAGLYGELADSRPSARALRRAKLARRRGGHLTLSERSVGRGGSLGDPLRPTGGRVGHPYLWAPFVHVGSLE